MVSKNFNIYYVTNLVLFLILMSDFIYRFKYIKMI